MQNKLGNGRNGVKNWYIGWVKIRLVSYGVEPDEASRSKYLIRARLEEQNLPSGPGHAIGLELLVVLLSGPMVGLDLLPIYGSSAKTKLAKSPPPWGSISNIAVRLPGMLPLGICCNLYCNRHISHIRRPGEEKSKGYGRWVKSI